MPRLHQYRNRLAYYVLTSIKGAVVTFQLTTDGERKLLAAAIAPGSQFPRALLLDLYRTGDAFTGGGGVGEPLPESLNQLELDFAQDPDSETAFPSCDDCASVDDVHLSILREQGALAAKLQCLHCRDVTSHTLDTCIPLRIVTLTLFGCLFEIKSVAKKYERVDRFENLLHTEFESKWEELRRRRGASQTSLFQSGLSNELNFAPTKK
ncbi:MAG: hypothetical protein WD688_12195 [Candidatus Binatia bacterium]